MHNVDKVGAGCASQSQVVVANLIANLIAARRKKERGLIMNKVGCEKKIIESFGCMPYYNNLGDSWRLYCVYKYRKLRRGLLIVDYKIRRK